MGNWPAEDWEGPFGYFKNEKLQASQLERLIEDQVVQENPQGFSIWLESGPLEMKGPLTQHRLSSLGLSTESIQYLQDLSSTFPKSENFDQTWLSHLAHQWSSTTFGTNKEFQNKPTPLFSSFYMREASRKGLERSLEWCEKNGVAVFKNVELIDLSFLNEKNFSGIEIKAEGSGLLKVDQLVWTLSSEESYFLNEKVARYLYPKGKHLPPWTWVRYRVKIKECIERESLPNHLLLIDKLDLPWTHENFCILKRSSSGEDFDAWIRIPNEQRFNKQYLKDREEKLKALLIQRMPEGQASIFDYPQEFNYNYQQLGPSRFPVFSQSQKEKMQSSTLSRKKFANGHFDSPEDWEHFTWESQLQNQTLLADKITLWWQALQIKLAEKRRKAQEKN
jgi:hypothetical protein